MRFSPGCNCCHPSCPCDPSQEDQEWADVVIDDADYSYHNPFGGTTFQTDGTWLFIAGVPGNQTNDAFLYREYNSVGCAGNYIEATIDVHQVVGDGAGNYAHAQSTDATLDTILTSTVGVQLRAGGLSSFGSLTAVVACFARPRFTEPSPNFGLQATGQTFTTFGSWTQTATNVGFRITDKGDFLYDVEALINGVTVFTHEAIELDLCGGLFIGPSNTDTGCWKNLNVFISNG